MRLAAAAAPNPLSMLTTVTPDAQEFSVARSAASPPNEAPYPTRVGTAMTGTFTSPPTTLGSAPSLPPTPMITVAARGMAVFGWGGGEDEARGAGGVEALDAVLERARRDGRFFGDREDARPRGADQDGAPPRGRRLGRGR